MSRLVIPASVIGRTLAPLKQAGLNQCECVVFWLGKRVADGTADVVEAWVPEQEAEADFFHIPRHAVAAVLARLRQTGLMIAAQVHSHPHEAFHSEADDHWAIVRHVGALSLVLPNFALRTTVENFFDHVAVFSLTAINKWIEVDAKEVPDRIEVIS